MAMSEKMIKTCSVSVEKLWEVFYKGGIHYHASSYAVAAVKYTTFYKVSILQEIILNLPSELWKAIFNINHFSIIKACN